MDKKYLLLPATFAVLAIITVFDFLIAIAALIVFSGVLFYTKNITKRDVGFLAVLFLVFAQMYFLYYMPAVTIARGQGTVLSDNWYQALTWMKQNTDECAVVATYWDPGHFITGIARRAVVFDGASQGNLFTRPYNYSSEGVIIEKQDSNINHIVLYSGGNKTTARIQDISTTLLTANETLAVSILSEYRKPGCEEMYYIASADLIPKSTWWTYFATWNPVDKKGTPYVYSSVPLGTARPDVRQNALVYTYPVSDQQAFVVYVTNDTIVVFFQQQSSEPVRVEKFIYFDDQGNGRLFTQENAGINGLVFIEPGAQSILFIPAELENAMFTRMFLFNGNGLENFEFVNNWGGEVKLYRVKFNETG